MKLHELAAQTFTNIEQGDGDLEIFTAAGLDLADLTGTCGPAGPVSKLQGVWLSHEGSSLIGRTGLPGRSGGRLGRTAGGSNEQQTRCHKNLRPVPK